jgi:hypothetical protein
MGSTRFWWIITPYVDEPLEWIVQCVDSVKTAATFLPNNLEIRHLLVSDGIYRREVRELTDFHIELVPGFGDYGDSPRYLASSYAKLVGAFALSYLDSDNWVYPNHFQTIFGEFKNSGACLITTEREFYDVHGAPLDAKCLTSDGVKFADTNCITLFQESLTLSEVWGFIPAEEHAIDDRVFWDLAKRASTVMSHTSTPTVAYRARSASFYYDLGESPPQDFVRPNGDGLQRAISAFAKRTGRSAVLKWEYLIPHNKPIRAKKVAIALMNRGEFVVAKDILNTVVTQIPHDTEVPKLLRICNRSRS